ncbi:MAG: pro-sigmaK processing inhibitor BofA family protein [Syntrophomonadales bacterium]|jgi:inhibitor of the pro-sigma K processing machinery
MSDTVWAVLIVMVVLILLAGLLIKPFQVIKKLAVKSGLGIALLILVNYVGGLLSFSLPFNPVTVLTAGFLGIPGILLLTYLQYMAK